MNPYGVTSRSSDPNWMASARWAAVIFSSPAKSAMVRATLARWQKGRGEPSEKAIGLLKRIFSQNRAQARSGRVWIRYWRP